MESSHFRPSVLNDPSTKRCSSIFDLGPYRPKFTPQNLHKIALSQLAWQIHRRCLSLPGGFLGWPITWNHVKCCGPTLVTKQQRIATKFGLVAEIQSPTSLLMICHIQYANWDEMWFNCCRWCSVMKIVPIYSILMRQQFAISKHEINGETTTQYFCPTVFVIIFASTSNKNRAKILTNH